MTELPYRSEHVADAIADSEELTNEELGAYIRLQRAFWRAGGYLASKDLGRFARAGKRWGRIGPILLRKLQIIEGQASCPLILDLLIRTRERRAKAADRAYKGAQVRWGIKVSGDRKRAITEGALKTATLLKLHEVGVLEASSKQCPTDANQNQSLIYSKTQSKDATATNGLAKEGRKDDAIYDLGVKLLTERVGTRALAARSQVAKWMAVVENADELGHILIAVQHENIRGAHFVAIMDQRLRGLRAERELGQTLPFGINVVK
jgi:uncharacterized protein YdaU (DUF1376 family)